IVVALRHGGSEGLREQRKPDHRASRAPTRARLGSLRAAGPLHTRVSPGMLRRQGRRFRRVYPRITRTGRENNKNNCTRSAQRKGPAEVTARAAGTVRPVPPPPPQPTEEFAPCRLTPAGTRHHNVSRKSTSLFAGRGGTMPALDCPQLRPYLAAAQDEQD